MSTAVDSAASPTYEISTEGHYALSAWFMGPKAENSKVMMRFLTQIVDRITRARLEYFPDDPVFITSGMQASDAYQREVEDQQRLLSSLTDLMSQYSIPFFSPRYMGHMCFDNSMPATLGYLTAMIHNPNNVAVEASPLATYIEFCVGQQLCKMLGYRTTADVSADDPSPVFHGWGHITCDGSVANLESLWVARNLKYYPLSLKWAMEEGRLGSIASSFTIPLTGKNGDSVLFREASAHNLLNLTPEAVLDIPMRLTKEYGISQTYLDAEVTKYLVQTVGREPLEKRYGVERTPKVLISKANHYSWPKGAAVLGIGKDNVHEIEVDSHIRMDVTQLELELLALTQAGHPIYAIIAIMGTTEHGSVDPLDKILELRRKFQDEHGVSFMVHCDAAWGGFFASLLRDPPSGYKGGRKLDDEYVPRQALSSYTETQLRCMGDANSITIDPHKSGYVPYPAGGLCYKDERAKYLITWTSPYINTGASDVESMGVYGLEGSKPGAAPVAAYASNEVIGLHCGGYGELLGEAMFTSVKLYAHWATMSLESETLIVTPINVLPAERDGKSAEEVEAQRVFIKQRIVDRPNTELVKDREGMALVKEMGSDLSINAFACNFRVSKGGPANTVVSEASYLNARIVERLSVTRVDNDARKKPVLLMGTELGEERYGKALQHFKRRLGLNPNDPAPLAGICNVSMTPFPTAGNFVRQLADAFRQVAEEEVQNCWRRIQDVPVMHSFIMQGTEELYLTYLPMFNLGSYRQQLVVSAKLPPDVMKAYATAQKENPGAIFTLHTSSQELLSSILQRQSCVVDIHQGLPILHGIASEPSAFSRTQMELTEIRVIKHANLAPSLLASQYPPVMPFFLYGSPTEQHIDHILLKSENVQLSSSSVKLDLGDGASDILNNRGGGAGFIVTLDDVCEYAVQPFDSRHQPEFFVAARSFRVSVYADPYGGYGLNPVDIHQLFDLIKLDNPLAQGTLTLGDSVYVDYTHLNRDTVPRLCLTPTEKLTEDTLLLSVSNDYQKIAHDIKQATSKGDASVALDIDEHILSRSALPQQYSLKKSQELDGGVVGQNKMHLSRFALQHASDSHSRQMAVRSGWKDAVESTLKSHGVRSANV